MRTTPTAALLVATGLVLTGCTADDDQPVASSTSSPASPIASATPTSPPPPAPSPTTSPDGVAALDAPITAQASSAPANGDPVAVTDVQVTAHDGFDRVVLTIGGDGEAGWQVRPDADPVAQGSGQELEVAGTTTLALAVTGVALPPEAPAPTYDGPERIEPQATSVVEEVLDGTVYEGQHTFYIGLDEPRPYRIDRRHDPQRIVLDITTM